MTQSRVYKQTTVELQVHGRETSTSGHLSASPYSKDSITLQVGSWGPQPKGIVLMDVSLDDLEKFITEARGQCEAVQWA